MSDDAIIALQSAASAATDWETVDLCDLALAGDGQARARLQAISDYSAAEAAWDALPDEERMRIMRDIRRATPQTEHN